MINHLRIAAIVLTSLLTVLLTVLPSRAQADENLNCANVSNLSNLSNLYFFGDSMSDSGAYAPLLGQNARFTNNPGTVWSENLGARYGKPVTTAYAAWQSGGPRTPGGFTPLSTGNNFAVGGARVNAVPGRIASFPGLAPDIPSVRTQISDFLARGPVDTDALYTIMAGANDILTQVSLVMANAATAEDADTAVVAAADDLVVQLARLQTAGVSMLMVIGLPDLGKTPASASLPASGSALLSGLSAAFNATLAAGVAGKNIHYFDGNKLFTAIFADPAAYGFTDTTSPACGTAAALGCVARADGHLFADSAHWSTDLHKVMADWLYSLRDDTRCLDVISRLPPVVASPVID